MTLRVTINGRTAVGLPGQTLFDCAERVGVSVPTSCLGKGKCRECLVEIESGAELLSPPAPQESHLHGAFRLACRTGFATGAAGEIRFHTLRRGTLRIETESHGLGFPGGPLNPAVTRAGGTVLLDCKPLAAATGPIHGLAVDIGTTTVAMRVYDLESGVLVATQSFENPQRFGGSDVMARIRYDGEQPGKLLQRTLLGYLGRAITSLPVDAGTIYEVVVAGNTTMRDLFFGLDVQPIGHLPYRSVTEAAWRNGVAASTSLVRTGRRLRLPIHPQARVYGLPVIGSHVGADAAAVLLAVGLAGREEISVVMDIGTNTELIVGNRARLMAASCPAGPAFEGGGVTCGMPALDGAIERVRIRDDGTVATTVIADAEPAGICGSGLVDLLSELRRTGAMNAQGRLADEPSFLLDAARRIALTETDINALAQAKGANAAGTRILLEAYGVPIERVDRFYLAGGFSAHLDLEAARRIGLIPDLPAERFVKVGNAALAGAAVALLSRRERATLEAVVKRVEHVQLEAQPRFFDMFVEGCQFERFGGGATR
jgi:uncharacterized 2Fe-2S/4Fe-4S cluster protein (DUF4445 family)